MRLPRQLRGVKIFVSIVLVTSFVLLVRKQHSYTIDKTSASSVSSSSEDDPEFTLKTLSLEIARLLNTTTAECRKLRVMGGRPRCSDCRKCLVDGNKPVCFDPAVIPTPLDCLVLSVGIGNDFSFDKAAARYGCRVISLDHTMPNWTHTAYGPRSHFLNGGLGVNDTSIMFTLVTKDQPQGRLHFSSFFTLDTLLELIDATNRTIDILKLDIENMEWNILDRLLRSKSSALNRVKQLSVEIHLEALMKRYKDENEAFDAFGKVYGILWRLEEVGFSLVYAALNSISNVTVTLDDERIPVYQEVLYVRTNGKK
ncbi:uncharacterized protein LOC143033706 [Oratosquilla oratoria]|uniref:uncharacterized protein LOC143033706 n=1 Tax=Oratosquilla oratoria TaxID=337810 RepID=UPI003F7739B3